MKILTVVGARPQFIKAAPVSRALIRSGIVERIVHTGQHYDLPMSKIFFDELEIPIPAYNLAVNGGDHGDMTGRMMAALEPVMLAERPDAVLVYGDTNSTLAGALVASKKHFAVIHVEAGLRSFNRQMPEEINRVLTDHLSDLLLCPTKTALKNLASEGISSGVHHVGDVMYDATVLVSQIARSQSDVMQRLELDGKPFALVTVHRAENTDDPEKLNKVVEWLRARSREIGIVFPVHPRTRHKLDAHGIRLDFVRQCEPLGYVDMTRLLSECTEVYTDSGGLQKEAYFHRKPCVTMRAETEWLETIECGWNRLWTISEYQPKQAIADFGDGHSAELIVNTIQEAL